MQTNKKQSNFSKYLDDSHPSPIMAALGAGLYPILFYYSNNYSLINSWKHLGFFIVLFVVGPIIGFIIVDKIAKRQVFQKWEKFVLPFFNVFTFLLFLELCLYAGIQLIMTLGILVIALLFAKFLSKYFKKLVILQLLLAVIGLLWLLPTLFTQLTNSNEWMLQPDDIEQAVFQKRPNVYYIQPDGYTNFSELEKGYYQIDNGEFKTFLEQNEFKIYYNIRSNYNSTLVSNSATFMMKHHYISNGFNFSEVVNGRDIIISKNTVLDIFKNNGYKTHFLPEYPYLLANQPKMGYDACNFDYDEVSLMGKGFNKKVNVLPSLEKFMEEDTLVSKFFFIEMFNPGHIPSEKSASQGAKIEKDLWLESLDEANRKLKEMISSIKTRDPNALIMIMSDHGGYVGMDYMLQMRIKSDDRDKLQSIFSTILAIHWPDNTPPEIDSQFNSAVNVFRILFSYLSEESKYLEHLQEEGSYLYIDKEAPKGIYQCLDSNGNVIFKRHRSE